MTTVAELIADLDGRELTAPDDIAEVALARAYLVPDDDGALLSRAIAATATTTTPSLHGGRSGLGWILAHVTDDDVVCSSIDSALERLVGDTWTGDFDLISGLAGFGIYALERGAAGIPLASRVLSRLEALAQPRGDGVAWFTDARHVPPLQIAQAPNGYWNAGMAHGTPGVIGVLARYVRSGVEPQRARALLERAVAWLLGAEPRTACPRYPGWYTEAGAPPCLPVAWCYGDLGISIALVSAARACDRSDWLDEGLAVARGSASRSVDAAGVVEPGICHGSAGAAYLFDRLHRISGDDAFAVASRAWLARTHELIDTRRHDVSFLQGTAGIALVLNALATDDATGWDRLLLADL